VHFPLFILIFCSLLGILVVFYFLHFRHRAFYMGPERLKSALSRTVSVEEEEGEEEESEEIEVGEEDLWEGLLQLESRLRFSIILTSIALVILLAPSILLTIFSTLPDLVLVLSAICILLVALLVSLAILRDIFRFLHAKMEEEGEPGANNE
jgi:hypothetical protein